MRWKKDVLGTRLATKIMYSCDLFSFLFFCYLHGKYVPESFIKESYRKNCIMRNLSWNSEKPSRQDVLENSTKFIVKRLCCWSLFFKWTCRMENCNFIKNRLQYRGFPVSFVKLSRISLLKKTSRRRLLEMTQLNLWHFDLRKLLANCIFFNQMQALYNLSWCVAH